MTLREIIGQDVIRQTYTYDKHPPKEGKKGSGNPTGHCMLLNKIPNLAVIDLDIIGLEEKDFEKEGLHPTPKEAQSINNAHKQMIRERILKKLPDDIIVQTSSGGLHIYCLQDGYFLNSNRNVNV